MGPAIYIQHRAFRIANKTAAARHIAVPETVPQLIGRLAEAVAIFIPGLRSCGIRLLALKNSPYAGNI